MLEWVAFGKFKYKTKVYGKIDFKSDRHGMITMV